MNKLLSNVLNTFLGWPTTRRYLAVFTVAFIVRGLAVLLLVSMRGLLTIADAADYIQYANYILEKGLFFTDLEGLHAHAGPGYPALIAFNFLLGGTSSFLVILLINITLSSLAVTAVYAMARMIMKPLWSILAALWYIFYIPHIWQAQFIGKESLVFGLFSFSVLAILKLSSKTKHYSKWLMSFVLAYAYLMHSDERYLIYLPIFLLYLTLFSNKSGIKKAVVAGGLIAITLIPWTIRNTKAFDRPVILTERTASITDRLLGYQRPVNQFRKEIYTYGTEEWVNYYLAAADSIQKGLPLKDPKRDKNVIKSLKEGIDDGHFPVKRNKFRASMSYLAEFWRPVRLRSDFYGFGFRYMLKWNVDRAIFQIFQYGVLLPFFLLGLFQWFRRRNKVIGLLALIIGIHCFVHVFLESVITRYRLPIDQFILLIAFWAASQLFEKSNRGDAAETSSN